MTFYAKIYIIIKESTKTERMDYTMDKVRIGVIGIGGMGSWHATYLYKGEVEGACLAAVCDIEPSKLSWAKEKFNNEIPVFDNYIDLIDSGLCDAVIVATPHYFHPTILVYAFEKGLHGLTEKPAGVFTKQVLEMNAAAEKSDKIFGIMYNQRTNPLYQKVRKMIQDGELGELRRCNWIITNWYRTQSYYDSGTWRATWSGEGGGVLTNQCPHNLDLWQWIFGMPTRVKASCYIGKYHDIEVEDDVTIYAEYANGATGLFVTTTGEFPGTNRLEITGDKGKVVIEHGAKYTKLQIGSQEFIQGSSGGFDTPPCEDIDILPEGIETGHVGITQNFANAILKGDKLLAPGYEGINGLQISNAAYLSGWTGGEFIDLPVDCDVYYEELKKKIACSKNKEAIKTNPLNFDGTFNNSSK